MEKQLSLHEKWALDAEAYGREKKIKTAIPQCESCVYYEKGNALHCKKFQNTRKPNEVMFAHKECPAFESASPIIFTPENSKEDKLFGGIIGFCVGDMLGVPVEFSSREERDSDPVRELRAYGTYHQPFGTWSDDTSLMLCLINAIINGFSKECLRDNMISYYQKGKFTADGDVFDIGVSTKNAISNMMQGVDPEKCGGLAESDNGNGSLMRILPVAFVCNKKTDSELVQFVSMLSSFTHGHPRSILACIFYTVFAKELFNGYQQDEAYDNAIDFLKLHCAPYLETESREYRAILSKAILSYDKKRIRSSGYVVDTLEAVLWAFFNSNSYSESVLNAVNLGGDTDTIAALVGGLSGVKYGYNSLPKNWIQCIRAKESIFNLTKQLVAYIDS